MENLFLKVHEVNELNVQCPLETLIVLNVYNFCNVANVQITFVVTEKNSKENCIQINVDNISHVTINGDQMPWEVSSCNLPAFLTQNRIITGLCAVSRYICKYKEVLSIHPEHPDGLLGFRKSCLQAPNEVSIWTKFCEIEIPETAIKLLAEDCDEETSFLPETLAKFENHLMQPLRIHNIYKVANDVINKDKNNISKNIVNQTTNNEEHKSPRTNAKKRNWKSKNSININCTTPIEDIGLEHSFAEGPFLTLADVLLYPCYYIILSLLNLQILEKKIPNTVKWFQKLKSLKQFDKINNISNTFHTKHKERLNTNYELPEILNQSLYKCDPKRNNSRKRLFTKESDVELALSLIKEDMEVVLIENNLNTLNKKVDWLTIPAGANPYGGHLPDKRKERKTQQLENLAISVINLAQNGDRIVDFCSGSGHLGILLAFLLPKCTIILLENKEESLNRASERVQNLNLKNVFLFQCNLDFFTGPFEIGVALHACGIATDLVIENCIKQNASFVVCPCCYGSLHATDRLQYPRSREFSNFPLDMYMCIGHAADQTHTDHPLEVRGARCMTIIDSDRSYYARNNGYEVQLTRLDPLSCTPKNMLIIGNSKPLNSIVNKIKCL